MTKRLAVFDYMESFWWQRNLPLQLFMSNGMY